MQPGWREHQPCGRPSRVAVWAPPASHVMTAPRCSLFEPPPPPGARREQSQGAARRCAVRFRTRWAALLSMLSRLLLRALLRCLRVPRPARCGQAVYQPCQLSAMSAGRRAKQKWPRCFCAPHCARQPPPRPQRTFWAAARLTRHDHRPWAPGWRQGDVLSLTARSASALSPRVQPGWRSGPAMVTRLHAARRVGGSPDS